MPCIQFDSAHDERYDLLGQTLICSKKVRRHDAIVRYILFDVEHDELYDSFDPNDEQI